MALQLVGFILSRHNIWAARTSLVTNADSCHPVMSILTSQAYYVDVWIYIASLMQRCNTPGCQGRREGSIRPEVTVKLRRDQGSRERSQLFYSHAHLWWLPSCV